MPADANPHGDIFGGWLLSQMDLAGGTAATRRARGRTATVAITAMTFHRPVFIGDEVTCYAEIIKVGTTSITVKVESWVRRGTGEEHIAVTEGIFTYVAVGSDRSVDAHVRKEPGKDEHRMLDPRVLRVRLDTVERRLRANARDLELGNERGRLTGRQSEDIDECIAARRHPPKS